MTNSAVEERKASRAGRGLVGSIRRTASSHPVMAGTGVVVVLGLVVFVLVWFQPQKLFIDATVDEDLPGLAGSVPSRGAGTGGAPGEMGPGMGMDPGAATKPEPAVLAQGAFRRLEHQTTGKALVVELPDGRRFLRLQDFETSNGPELRVYLSEIPAGDDWFAYGERFVDLGSLKGNIGNQNYELPRDLDLGRYRSAVIWCRRFSVGFGVAPLDRTDNAPA